MTRRAAVVASVVIALGGVAFARGAKPPKPKAPPPPPAPEPLKPGDPRRIIGILDVRVDGAPPEIGAQFQKDLEAQVDIKHYFLAPKMRMHDLMANSTKWTEGCVVGECLKDVKAQTNADIVLLAALTGSGTSFGWVVTLVRTDTGNAIAQKSERCDVCTVSEALSAATLATVDLLTTIPDQLPGEVRHVVTPQPVAAVGPVDDRLARTVHHERVGGVTLAIVGLATAAAGAAIYYGHDHTRYGLATAGAGGGLALGGVVVLTF